MIRHSQGPDMIESGYPIPSQGVDLVLGEDHSKDPLMIISVPRLCHSKTLTSNGLRGTLGGLCLVMSLLFVI